MRLHEGIKLAKYHVYLLFSNISLQATNNIQNAAHVGIAIKVILQILSTKTCKKLKALKMNPKGDNGKMTLAAHPVVTVVGSALTNAMDIFAINTQENVHRVDFLEP